MGEERDFLPPDWTPETLMHLHLRSAATQICATALKLGVFSRIAAGDDRLAALAGVTGSSERGMRMLLDALAAMKLLRKSREQYALTPAARAYLVRESPDYMGAVLEHLDVAWATWGSLSEAVRTGVPPRRVERREQAEKFFPLLIRSLHVVSREPAARMARALGAGTSPRGCRVVDVACGSAVWSIAVAEADRQARVTANDFPAVLALTAEYTQRHGVADRYELLPGDFHEVDFGEARFDLAILGNIVHSEGRDSARDLLRRMSRALAPGGRVAIVDMLPDDDRAGPYYPVMFALNMLLNTEAGDTYTRSEYDRWLSDAGFARVETADIGTGSPLVIGVKGKE